MPYYNDEGKEMNPALYPKPCLCIGCKRDASRDELENILCNLTRLEQGDEDEFICLAFIPLSRVQRRTG